MLNIKSLVHTGTMVTSLNNAIKKVRVNGVLSTDDLYIANAVYSLLNTLCLDLTNNQRRELINTYNNLVFKSDQICSELILNHNTVDISNHISNYVDPSTIFKDDNIYYWKATISETDENILNTLDESKILGSNKIIRNDASQNLPLNISGVGKYCIFIKRLTNNISVFDILNNDITNYFNYYPADELNGVLLITKNMHTSDIVNLKINFYE